MIFSAFSPQPAGAFFKGLEEKISKQFKKQEEGHVSPKETEKREIQPLQAYATSLKAVNLRSGPGTEHNKIKTLSPGTVVVVVETRGNWMKIKVPLPSGTTAKGWASKPFFKLHDLGYRPPVQSETASANVSPPQAETKHESPSQALDQSPEQSPDGEQLQNVLYAGYSKEFQPVKQMLILGDLDGVEKFYAEKEEKITKNKSKKSDWDVVKSVGLLRWIERGTLHLDQGNLDGSIRAFTNAEDILDFRQSPSGKKGKTITRSLGFLLETITGNEEIRPYSGEGYEKVLMLNYKSISYLLKGDRKAYNVTRRAIDWQNLEKEAFQKKLEKTIRDLKSKEASNTQADSTSVENSAASPAANLSPANTGWTKKYQEFDSIADRVPSAFVNPFGYYVSGMIQEFESRKDGSMRDNARISYSHALELNPQSEVLQEAIEDMKSNKNHGNKRLVHVVVADGFVPEKKMLVYQIPIPGGALPIKLPLYEPVASKVSRVEVQTGDGKRLAELSLVADVEAICLRHQKDTEPFRMLRVALSIARSGGINQLASQGGVAGTFLGMAADSMAAPDMRSWMSLPSSIQAARLYVSKDVKNLKIVSYDKQGQSLAEKVVDVNQGSDAFIYARSIETQMYTNGSKDFWVAAP